MSYSFYLIHGAVLVAVSHTLDRGPTANICTALLVSLTASWLLHNGVEQPCFRRWAARRDTSMASRDTAAVEQPSPL